MREYLKLVSIFFLLTSIAFAQSVGDLVITEIMPAPNAAGSSEYFDIYNHTVSGIDIDGFIIEDLSANTHTINNGGALIVPAGGFLLLATDADPLGDASLTPDYVYSGVILNNSNEELYLKQGVTTIAQIAYSSSSSGVALEAKYVVAGIDGSLVDSDLIDATNTMSNGDKGSPNAAGNTYLDPDINLSPSAGDIIISEFMPDPSDVGDSDGEYIEIYNSTSKTIALDDCEIDGSTISELTTIAAGQFFVFGRNGDSNANGGVPVDFETSFALTNSSSDAIVLVSSSAVEIDRVDYTTAFGFSAGVSAVFTGSSIDDNNVSSNWSASTVRENYSNPVGDEIDKGSPGVKGSIAVLPVELTTFTADLTNNSVELNWQTATETNNAGFEIQRSVNDWETLLFISGAGNSNSPKNYSYADNDLPNADKVSYRLKQIDNDGTSTYSKIVEVDLSTITDVDDENKTYEFGLDQNYPNPFNSSTTIKYTLPELSGQQIVKLRVSNLLGQQVANFVNASQSAGEYEVNFDAGNLPSGIYFYTLSYGSYIQTRKLVLMK